MRRLKRIRDEIQSYQDEFYGDVAIYLADLYHQLIEANKKTRESPSAEHAQAVADLRRAVETVVQAANYSYTRSGFESLRRRLAGAAAVFAAGIVVFAYAANPPKPAATVTSTGHPAAQHSPAQKATITPRSPAASISARAGYG